MTKCKYCGAEIDGRDDISYCRDNATCRSLYHQESGRDYRGDYVSHLVHEIKPHEHGFDCAVCGKEFAVNDYALRGGERAPMYCSRACKQKAYRQRLKNKG